MKFLIVITSFIII